MLRSAAAIALSLTPLVGQERTFDLRSMARPGKPFWFVETSEQLQQVGGESGQRVGLRYERTFSVTIRKVEANGDFIASVDVHRVRGSVDLPMVGAKTFDSGDERTKKDPAATAGLGSSVGYMLDSIDHDYIARVDVHGNVKAAHVKVAATAEQDEVAQAWHEHAVTRLCEAAFGQLPTRPVAVGAGWNYTRNSPKGNLPLMHAGKMKLQSIDDETFVLALTGELKRRPKQPNDPTIDFTVNGGKLTGEQTISRRTGFVQTSTIRATATLVVRSQLGETKSRMTVATSLRRIPAPKTNKANKQPAKVR